MIATLWAFRLPIIAGLSALAIGGLWLLYDAATARADLAEAHRATLESAHVEALAVLDEVQADHARTLGIIATVDAERRRRAKQTAREIDRLRAIQSDSTAPASPACGAWAAGG